MKINIFTEIGRITDKTTRIVTGDKYLRKKGLEVVVNVKKNYDTFHVHLLLPFFLVKAFWKQKPVVITTVLDEMGLFYHGISNIESLVVHHLRFFYNQANLLIFSLNFSKNIVRKIVFFTSIILHSEGVYFHKFFVLEG